MGEVWSQGGMHQTPGDGEGEDAGNLLFTDFRCPICNNILDLPKVKKIAMRQCKWQFKGVYRKGGNQKFGWTTQKQHTGADWLYVDGDLQWYNRLYVHCVEV